MFPVKNIHSEPIAIMSDDLTGANEIGLVLAEHLDSHLVLNNITSNAKLDPLIEKYAGVVVNLNTRDYPADTARRIVSEVLTNNPNLSGRLIYKKIDSTLRGNLSEELTAILDNDLADVIYFVPASPLSKRFTVDGHQLVGNLPIALTEYAEGLSVSGTSYLPDILGRNLKYKVQSIRMNQLQAGFRNVAQLTMDFYKAGFRIITCDANCQRDLIVIRDAVLNSPLKILPAGSAALFKEFFTSGMDTYERPCVVICGSLNSHSREQTQKLIDSGMVAEIRIDLDRALSEKRETEIDRIIQLAIASYNEKRNLLLQTPLTPFAPDANAVTSSSKSVHNSIDQLLGNIVSRLLETIRVSGLILTGGSVAAGVINQLGANGITIVKDLHPLAPVARLAGGPFDGLRVVTKGGGVGEMDVLVRAVNYICYGR